VLILEGEFRDGVRRLISELQRERAHQGLTAGDVADRMDFERLEFIRIEAGVVDPPYSFIGAYARALGTAIHIEVKLLPTEEKAV